MSERADVCQDCWEQVRATEYFPESYRYGTCIMCWNAALVARVSMREVKGKTWADKQRAHSEAVIARAREDIATQGWAQVDMNELLGIKRV